LNFTNILDFIIGNCWLTATRDTSAHYYVRCKTGTTVLRCSTYA